MPSNSVHYHLPDDDQFSLDYVADSREALNGRLDSYSDSTDVEVRQSGLDEVVWLIYSNSGPTGSVDDLEFDLGDAFRSMNPNVRPIVREYFQIFKGVNNENIEEEGEPLEAYKQLEIERVPNSIDRVRWNDSVRMAGGTLISNLILKHALPNANHRTAFGMLERYLETVDDSFQMPSMATDDFDWQQWVDSYIVDSKRITTVRRNVATFGILREFGCSNVRRKGGIEIELEQYDLTIDYRDALEKYARHHEQRSVKFVDSILQNANCEYLRTEPGLSMEEFAKRIT